MRIASSIPGLGRSLGGVHANPLQHSCLEKSMNRGAWRAEPGGLQPIGSQRVGLNWSDLACTQAWFYSLFFRNFHSIFHNGFILPLLLNFPNFLFSFFHSFLPPFHPSFLISCFFFLFFFFCLSHKACRILIFRPIPSAVEEQSLSNLTFFFFLGIFFPLYFFDWKREI